MGRRDVDSDGIKLVYICPMCGAGLKYSALLSNPPKYIVHCEECEWYWCGDFDFKEIRTPFMPPQTYDWNTAIEIVPECCKTCTNHPANGGSGICFCALPAFAKGDVVN